MGLTGNQGYEPSVQENEPLVEQTNHIVGL